MKIKSIILLTILSLLTVVGCTSQPVEAEAKAQPDPVKPDVKMVSARESESGKKKWGFKVDEDGSFYEVLPEDDRLCADCDR